MTQRPLVFVRSALRDLRAFPQEIRIHSEGEWRVIYVASLPAAAYVLHAFGKKSQRTNPLDIAVARARLRIARASAGA